MVDGVKTVIKISWDAFAIRGAASPVYSSVLVVQCYYESPDNRFC